MASTVPVRNAEGITGKIFSRLDFESEYQDINLNGAFCSEDHNGP